MNACCSITTSSRSSWILTLLMIFDWFSLISSRRCMSRGEWQSSLWTKHTFEISHVLQWLKIVAWMNFTHVLILLDATFWTHIEWCLFLVYLVQEIYWWALFSCSLFHLQPLVLFPKFLHVQPLQVSPLLTCLIYKNLFSSFTTFSQPLSIM